MIVVDASVAVKWFVREEFAQQAIDLRVTSIIRGIDLVGPELLLFEVANAIYWQHRRGLITLNEADAAIAEYSRLGIEIHRTEQLLPMAVSLARAHKLPAVYDAVYVVLARELNAEFWTADRRLFKAVADHAPWVRWIAEWGID